MENKKVLIFSIIALLLIIAAIVIFAVKLNLLDPSLKASNIASGSERQMVESTMEQYFSAQRNYMNCLLDLYEGLGEDCDSKSEIANNAEVDYNTAILEWQKTINI